MSEEIAILSRLRAPEGAVRNKKRVGRGIGSGLGKTSGRGMKGQKARQPGNIHKLHFEGGQMPLNRRLPKVGFNSLNPTNYAPVNVAALNVFDNGATVDEATLRERGIVRGRYDGVKILGTGELTKKLSLKVGAISETAKGKVEQAGGSVEVTVRAVAPLVRHKHREAKAKAKARNAKTAAKG